MIECEPATDSSPIAQGDVFEWSTPRFGHSLGIVVTADCDITWKKFGAFLTYVPMLPLHDYLSTDHLPSQCKSAAAKLLPQIARQIDTIRAQSRPEFSSQLTLETLEHWLLDSTSDDIVEALGAPESGATNRLREAIQNWRQLQNAPSEQIAFEQLIHLLIRSTNTTESAINKRIHDHIQRLPGDRLYLSTVGGRDESGFVVMIRNLREIAEDEIAIKVTQLSARPAKRIARLGSPYRYRLTQQLGDVFAAIGLPKEYEQRRDELLHQAYELKGSPR